MFRVLSGPTRSPNQTPNSALGLKEYILYLITRNPPSNLKINDQKYFDIVSQIELEDGTVVRDYMELCSPDSEMYYTKCLKAKNE